MFAPSEYSHRISKVLAMAAILSFPFAGPRAAETQDAGSFLSGLNERATQHRHHTVSHHPSVGHSIFTAATEASAPRTGNMSASGDDVAGLREPDHKCR